MAYSGGFEKYRNFFDTIYKCKKCNYSSQCWKLLMNHSEGHRVSSQQITCEQRTIDKYNCRKCNFVTDYLVILREHLMYYHINSDNQEIFDKRPFKKYKCNYCTFGSFSAVVLISHSSTSSCAGRNSHHWFKCAKCDYRTKVNVRLRRHILRRHVTEESKLKCMHRSFQTKRRRGEHVLCETPLRLQARHWAHFPKHIDPTPRKKNPTRICKVCYKHKIRSETTWECKECKVALHLPECFRIYHTIEDY